MPAYTQPNTPVPSDIQYSDPYGDPARGAQLLMQGQGACLGCHTIRGTSATGTAGPDLTHVDARATLAAVTIRNDPRSLAEWIRDPQHVKPGNKMPDLPLTSAQVHALVAYLDSLR